MSLRADVRALIERFLVDKQVSPEKASTNEVYNYVVYQEPAYRRKKSSVIKKTVAELLMSMEKDPQYQFESEDDAESGTASEADEKVLSSSSSLVNMIDLDAEPVDAFSTNLVVTESTPRLVEAKDQNMFNQGLQQHYKKVAGQQTPSKPGKRPRDENGKTGDSPSQKKRKLAEGKGSKSGSQPKTPKKQPLSASSSSGSPLDPQPTLTFDDIGGIEDRIQDVRELIEWPLMHPEIYQHLGVEPPHGILLFGPPGCGKTLLANAIAGELGVPFLKISAPEIVTSLSGESEQLLRKLFNKAKLLAPSIIFIDEIDAIATRRESSQKEMEKRIVAQLLSCMDEINGTSVASSKLTAQDQQDAALFNGTNDNIKDPEEENRIKPVIVIGATNHPDNIDPALRRAGRFDREIHLGVPNVEARERILRVLVKKLRLSGDFDLREIAKLTPGYVGADLAAITKEAAILAVNRIFHSLEGESSIFDSKLKARPFNPSTASSSSSSSSEDNPKVIDLEDDPFVGKTEPQEPAKPIKSESTLVPLTTEAEGSMSDDKEEGKQEKDDEEVKTEEKGKSGPETVTFNKQMHQIDQKIVDRNNISNRLRAQKVPLSVEQMNSLAISMKDFLEAIKHVQPSAKRQGFATVPNVTWDQVGALTDVRQELRMAILEPIRRPHTYKALGLGNPAGVLLYGPPGCGKTLLAKAIANDAQANFISVKGPELLNKYVGESEKAVRLTFERARASSPCVVFFDEMDALCPMRSANNSGGSNVTERVVNQMLTELDGIDARNEVFVIAATNRPDIIDPAMLRPGRLDKLLYVPLPSPEDRAQIVSTLTRHTPLADDVDPAAIARSDRCQRFSGADLAALVREATVCCLRQHLLETDDVKDDDMFINVDEKNSPLKVTTAHFEAALSMIRPSVSEAEERRYKSLRDVIKSSRIPAN